MRLFLKVKFQDVVLRTSSLGPASPDPIQLLNNKKQDRTPSPSKEMADIVPPSIHIKAAADGFKDVNDGVQYSQAKRKDSLNK